MQVLRDADFRVIFGPEADELERGMGLNFVALGPYRVLMPGGCPGTRASLEKAGVECIELEVPELIKAEGTIACATGILWREG